MRTTIQSQLRLAANLGALVEKIEGERIGCPEFLATLSRIHGADGGILTLRLHDGDIAAWTHQLDDVRARRMLGQGLAPPALLAYDGDPVARLGDLAEDGDGSLIDLEEDFMNRLGVKHVLCVAAQGGRLLLCRSAERDTFSDETLAVLSSLEGLLATGFSGLARGQNASGAVLTTIEPDEPIPATGVGSLDASCPVPLVLVDSGVRVVSANPAAHRKLDLHGDPPSLPGWLAQTVGDRLTELLTSGGIPDGASGDYQFVQPLGRRMMRLGLVPLESDNGDARWLLSVEHGGPSLEERMKTLMSRYGLKPGELEIVELLVEGLRNARIAEELSVSEATVKYRLGRVMEKTGTTNRADLIATVFSELPTG